LELNEKEEPKPNSIKNIGGMESSIRFKDKMPATNSHYGKRNVEEDD
jgi:hypothetical protein